MVFGASLILAAPSSATAQTQAGAVNANGSTSTQAPEAPKCACDPEKAQRISLTSIITKTYERLTAEMKADPSVDEAFIPIGDILQPANDALVGADGNGGAMAALRTKYPKLYQRYLEIEREVLAKYCAQENLSRVSLTAIISEVYDRLTAEMKADPSVDEAFMPIGDILKPANDALVGEDGKGGAMADMRKNTPTFYQRYLEIETAVIREEQCHCLPIPQITSVSLSRADGKAIADSQVCGATVTITIKGTNLPPQEHLLVDILKGTTADPAIKFASRPTVNKAGTEIKLTIIAPDADAAGLVTGAKGIRIADDRNKDKVKAEKRAVIILCGDSGADSGDGANRPGWRDIFSDRYSLQPGMFVVNADDRVLRGGAVVAGKSTHPTAGAIPHYGVGGSVRFRITGPGAAVDLPNFESYVQAGAGYVSDGGDNESGSANVGAGLRYRVAPQFQPGVYGDFEYQQDDHAVSDRQFATGSKATGTVGAAIASQWTEAFSTGVYGEYGTRVFHTREFYQWDSDYRGDRQTFKFGVNGRYDLGSNRYFAAPALGASYAQYLRGQESAPDTLHPDVAFYNHLDGYGFTAQLDWPHTAFQWYVQGGYSAQQLSNLTDNTDWSKSKHWSVGAGALFGLGRIELWTGKVRANQYEGDASRYTYAQADWIPDIKGAPGFLSAFDLGLSHRWGENNHWVGGVYIDIAQFVAGCLPGDRNAGQNMTGPRSSTQWSMPVGSEFFSPFSLHPFMTRPMPESRKNKPAPKAPVPAAKKSQPAAKKENASTGVNLTASAGASNPAATPAPAASTTASEKSMSEKAAEGLDQ